MIDFIPSPLTVFHKMVTLYRNTHFLNYEDKVIRTVLYSVLRAPFYRLIFKKCDKQLFGNIRIRKVISPPFNKSQDICSFANS